LEEQDADLAISQTVMSTCSKPGNNIKEALSFQQRHERVHTTKIAVDNAGQYVPSRDPKSSFICEKSEIVFWNMAPNWLYEHWKIHSGGEIS
jgi:hypothetical protein